MVAISDANNIFQSILVNSNILAYFSFSFLNYPYRESMPFNVFKAPLHKSIYILKIIMKYKTLGKSFRTKKSLMLSFLLLPNTQLGQSTTG